MIREMALGCDEWVVAFRGGQRWVRFYETTPLREPADKTTPAPLLQKGGVYLVLGGLGGIGLALAEHLAVRTKGDIILTGRSGLENRPPEVREKIAALEQMGATITVLAADIAEKEQLAVVVGTIKERFGKLHGVIHAAGHVDYGGVIQARELVQSTSGVFAPKLSGALNLEILLAEAGLKPGFAVLCSSLASVIPPFGQVAYCAVNAFFDAYVLYRAHVDGSVGSVGSEDSDGIGGLFDSSPKIIYRGVNWSAWQQVGMAVEAVRRKGGDPEEALKDDISPDEGKLALDRLLNCQFPQVVVSSRNLHNLMAAMQQSAQQKETREDVVMEEVAEEHLNPRPHLETAYVEPSTDVEKRMAHIWGQFFGLRQVGVDDDFFELGGDSLKAMTVTGFIHKEFNVKISLAEFFNRCTVGELSAVIGHSGEEADTYASIEAVEEREYYPLSSAQKRLYFLQQMDPTSISYNIPFVFPIGKDMEIPRLEETFKLLIARHESLRTSFREVNDMPVQRVHRVEDVEFRLDYLEADPVEAQRIAANYTRPFDLENAPLIRSGIIKLPDGHHIWMVDIHHIVSDGTSETILADDFMAIYGGQTLEPLPIRYKDFSQWQNGLFESGKIKEQEDYWFGQFPPGGDIPRLNLPADFKRPEVFQFSGEAFEFRLEEEMTARFKALSATQSGTLYMNVLAALNTLFYKYTGQTDIIIGSGIAGRPHPDLQNIIGMFVNTLAMRNVPEGGKPYDGFLKEVVGNSVRAFENQDVQFEELVDKLDLERDASRNPLFDICMVVQNFRSMGSGSSTGSAADAALDGQVETLPVSEDSLADHGVEYRNTTSKFDMTFYINESDDNLLMTIEYYTCIFKEETVRAMVAHLKNVIKYVVEKPGTPLKEIDFITEEEKKRVLFDLNDTSSPYQKDKTIHALFLEQAERTPEAEALVVGLPSGQVLQKLTYGELERKARQVAFYLRFTRGVETEKCVGIWMSPSPDRAVAILGVLMAGAAYVPIDPKLPEERIKYMLDDADIGVVLSQKKYVRGLNRLLWECPSFHSYLCLDSDNILQEEEAEESELMGEELWHHVGETATDEITGGGWLSSYTGKPLSKAEMDEYGDNTLKKLEPLLHEGMRVLEIGAASGITMYRIAPKVALYYGTDLSRVIIDKNRRRVAEEGHQNIKLAALAAHDIDMVEERDFDLVIINSVIQCFHGHNYLRKVIGKAVDLMGDDGYLFIGDVMDLERRDTMLKDLVAFKQAHRDMDYSTKTDFSTELFVSRAFWQDLVAQWEEMESVTFTGKIGTIENELTKFRYDTLFRVRKGAGEEAAGQKGVVKQQVKQQKFQDDSRALNAEPGQLPVAHEPGNLAYIIYTSGTTGRPKGVMVEHGALVNLCQWHNHYYNIKPSDRATLYAGFGFDASVWEFFPYLVSGASLHPLEESLRLDIDGLQSYFRNHEITVSFLPTQLCEQFMTAEIPSLRLLLAGGDKLHKMPPRGCSFSLYNNYGPTENTVVTTAYRVAGDSAPGSGNIPIGKPVDNTAVLILGWESVCLQPVGVPGELCITGDGLARGYLNNPELTADTFVALDPSPFPSDAFPYPRVIYKSGDLARFLPDGNIEFLGRIDHQVKIRGFRIELGEIENRLLALSEIKEAVVVDRENADDGGGKYLCAYFIPSAPGTVDTGDLKTALSRGLPEYMVPAHWVQLDKMPLTPAGKVDRRALPAPEIGGGEDVAAPRTEVEETLRNIWAEVLDVDPRVVGVNSNFFDLGGHSLRATIVTSRVHKVLGVKIPLAEIFTHQTIRGLAEYVESLEREAYAAIPRAKEKDFYPLSSAQERLYILQQMELESAAYNIFNMMPMPLMVEVSQLEETFKKLIQRHESLRTSFTLINEIPMQRIHESVDFKITEYQLEKEAHNGSASPEPPFSSKAVQSGVQGPATREGVMPPPGARRVGAPGGASEAQALEALRDSFIRPFDLTCAPLLRVGLVWMADGNPMLMVDAHHIITDGSSLDALIREFDALMEGGILEPMRLQYKDYAVWQRSPGQQEAVRKQENYWLGRFADELPVLNLPTDFPRPFMQRFDGCSVNFYTTPEETRSIRRIVKETGVTLYMALLSLHTLWLSKLSGLEDITVGTPIAAKRHADLEPIVGMFANTLAMRNYPRGGMGCRHFLEEVKAATLEAFENQEYPFEELVDKVGVRRDTSRNPIFDVMFNLLNQLETKGFIPRKEEHGDEEQEGQIERYRHIRGTSKFDLNLTAVDLEDYFLFNLEYCTHLFKEETINRFIDYFRRLLTQLPLKLDMGAAEGNRLADLDILGEEEKMDILRMSWGENDDISQAVTIVSLFNQQVARTPALRALTGPFGDGNERGTGVDAAEGAVFETMTYSRLDAYSDRLAGVLRAKGLTRGAVVGLMAERSPRLVAAALAILKAGGAYLPIDAEYPAERKRFMLADSGASLLVTDALDTSEPTSEPTRFLPEGVVTVDLLAGETIKTEDITTSQPVSIDGSDLLYVIYTSGSTGTPKGVMLEHRNLVNLMEYQYRFTDIDFSKVLQFTTISFDVSFQEIFSTLLWGGELFLIKKELRNNIPALFNVIERNGIKTLFLPAAYLKFVLGEEEYAEAMPGCVDHIVSAGEQVVITDGFRRYLQKKQVYLHNHYGPSETHVVTALTLDPSGHLPELPSIGRSVTNTGILILSPHGQLQLKGVPGELCIAGVQVGRGYLNNPELTAEKFQPLPTSLAHLSSPFYKTGDLARYLPDGTIEFLGRMDHQVKIRGFRVETGEIENRLLSQNGIREAAVLARTDDRGETYLCAYLVPVEPGREIEGLRDILAALMPDYMVPAYFVYLERIPLTANGKIDRRKLPAPEITAGEEDILPRNGAEKALAAIWGDVLNLDPAVIGINRNFFQLGGHSLKATIMAARVHKILDVRLPLAEVFRTPTIKGLANYIASASKEGFVALEAAEKREYYPLSPGQKRLYVLQQMRLEGTAYNMPYVFPIDEPVDVEALATIFRYLMDRHESLRTSFKTVGEEPVQVIHPERSLPFDITYCDGSTTAGFAVPWMDGDATSLDEAVSAFIRPFDLSEAPLLRVGLIGLGEKETIFLMDMHHIITDGVSQELFVRSAAILYHS